MRSFPSLLSAAAALALLAPTSAAARDRDRDRDLWATVNVCDTAKHPDEMGVRGRMSGNGRRGRMYMRFIAQFRHDEDGWRRVGGRARSRWLYAGRSVYRYRELGYTFSFGAPPTDRTYLMRGLVKYKWVNRRGRVIRRARRITEGGHRSAGADPRRFSAARCRIR